MKLSFTDSNGVAIDFFNRSDLSRTFGSWISVKESITSSDVVSWCNRRIEIYEHWIKECNKFKSEHQAKLLEGLAPEARLAGLTKEQLQAALATMNAEAEKAE